jgi:hypothetical protein
VEIYDVGASLLGSPKPKALVRFIKLFVLWAPIYFLFYILIEWVWPGYSERVGVKRIVIQALIWACSMSLFFSFKKANEYQLCVDDEEIRATNFRENNRLFARCVRRGQIRTIVENERGLLISGHGRIGTFFWGGVWIPKQVADYEYLKRLAVSWQEAEK